jgi:hypothetical protein
LTGTSVSAVPTARINAAGITRPVPAPIKVDRQPRIAPTPDHDDHHLGDLHSRREERGGRDRGVDHGIVIGDVYKGAGAG